MTQPNEPTYEELLAENRALRIQIDRLITAIDDQVIPSASKAIYVMMEARDTLQNLRRG